MEEMRESISQKEITSEVQFQTQLYSIVQLIPSVLVVFLLVAWLFAI